MTAVCFGFGGHRPPLQKIPLRTLKGNFLGIPPSLSRGYGAAGDYARDDGKPCETPKSPSRAGVYALSPDLYRNNHDQLVGLSDLV
jgi:hypothetical protein